MLERDSFNELLHIDNSVSADRRNIQVFTYKLLTVYLRSQSGIISD